MLRGTEVKKVFTVVITEQTHLDSIQEYKTFLKPFLDNSHIAFCTWDPEGQTLNEAVPQLYETVSRHDRWRLIVACDEEGLETKNPFDRVGYKDPEQPRDMDDSEYAQLCREGRLAAYEQASKKPLARLMTWLCQQPLVSNDNNPFDEEDSAYSAFHEYLIQAKAKAEIRQKLLGDYVSQITMPAEIICVAKRCYKEEAYDIRNSWKNRDDLQYSRFWDWNLYFERMRYLVFDILPKTHRNYTFDYIRFLYALMVLAENEVPLATLAPNRVYVMDCENDEEALSRLLGAYDSKLAATQENIRYQIMQIKNSVKPRLDDRDAEAIFCSHITVPVSALKGFDSGKLFVPGKKIGLSTDCPRDEANAWSKGFKDSRQALGRYLKLPKRALRKTTSELHRINTADLSNARNLNEFQLEDVEEYVANEELKMIGTKTSDFYNIDRYIERLETQNKRINTVIERRMTRKWTLILGFLALALYFCSFIPMFVSNIKASNGTLFSLFFMGAGLGLMALLAYVTLFFLRKPLRAAYSDYNGIMRGVVNEVESSLGEYSIYLSHACNMMRGYSVLNFVRETEDPDAGKIRMLKKHEMDIQGVREELREVFGIFLPQEVKINPNDCFDFNYLRPVTFHYAIPYSSDQRRMIEFMQNGNKVEIPVDFVKAVRIRREELYD